MARKNGKLKKVEWFRSRERYKRWEEEFMLLKQEMVMSCRDLRTRQMIWEFKAASLLNTKGMSQYTSKKAWFFRQLSVDLLDCCRAHIRDPIVCFKWSEEWLATKEEAINIGS
ncbi:hypothetical protein BDV93DRAFT_562822 [Ceratobasidium sp. AG-I]|nr:hypothetical protein BDV93DRAFT_562822 [Ceratobasidium sp. AG-I]